MCVLLAGIALALVLAVTGCEKSGKSDSETAQPPTTTADDVSSDGEVLSADASNFEELVLNSPVPVLLDCFTNWCPPCHMLHPNLEEIAEEYAGQLRVVQVDVDKNQQVAQRYNVRSIPALFVIRDGDVVDRSVGYMSVDQLKKLIGPHL